MNETAPNGDGANEPPDVDRSDLIVGTMTMPAWMRAVPPTAWLFIALATVEAWLLVAGIGVIEERDLLGWLTLFAIVGAQTATVLLPAAVLLGPTVGRVRRWLLAGTVAVAMAAIIETAYQSRGFLGLVAGPPGDDGALGLLVAIVLPIGAVLGLAALVMAVRRARPADADGRTTGWRRSVMVVALVTVAIQGWFLVQSLQALLQVDDLATSPPLVTLSGVLGVAATLLWGLIVADAVAAWRVTRTRAWQLIAIGGGLELAARAVITLVSGLVAVVQVGDLGWLILLSPFVHLGSGLALLAGLFLGPGADRGDWIGEPDESVDPGARASAAVG
jgi:hypothetical protein